MARFVLVESVRQQTEAMLKGLDEVVERRLLSTLKPEELEVRFLSLCDAFCFKVENLTCFSFGFAGLNSCWFVGSQR